MYDKKFNLCDFLLNLPLWILGFKMIRNGSSWTNRSWCWMWLEQRSVEEHGQLRLDFTNFHELKPFLKYIKGHKLKINFTLVEKWKMSPRRYTVRSQIHGLEFSQERKRLIQKASREWIKSEIGYGLKMDQKWPRRFEDLSYLKTNTWKEYAFGEMSHPTYVISLSSEVKWNVFIWIKYSISLTCLKIWSQKQITAQIKT